MSSSLRETFFERWTRRKAEHAAALAVKSPQPAAGAMPGAVADLSAPPTLADVAGLAADADYSGFIKLGVDKAVHRAAMKKLFADPHFNVMDGLDIYIDDYNVASPVSPAMLAALAHAKSTLDPKPAWRIEQSNPDSVTPVAPAAGAAPPVQAMQAVQPDVPAGATNAEPVLQVGDPDRQAAVPIPEHNSDIDMNPQTPPNPVLRNEKEGAQG